MSRLLNNISRHIPALWAHAPTYSKPGDYLSIEQRSEKKKKYTQIRTTNNSKIDLTFPCTNETGMANRPPLFIYFVCSLFVALKGC